MTGTCAVIRPTHIIPRHGIDSGLIQTQISTDTEGTLQSLCSTLQTWAAITLITGNMDVTRIVLQEGAVRAMPQR